MITIDENKTFSNEDTNTALSLYVLVKRGIGEFLECALESTTESLEYLYLMLTTPHENMSEENRQLNAEYAPIVEKLLAKRVRQ